MTTPDPAKKTVAKKTAAARPPTDETAEAREERLWAELTAPFPEDWIEKLPKTLKRQDDDKGTCTERSRYSADGFACGKYHARAVHLDYVGHAGITMRLNDVLGPGGWDFQPYTETPEGVPGIVRGEFYAKLTIMGVTKWDLAANFSGSQEAYGDALRRCAMRFGMGTYLWSKSDHAYNLARIPDEPEPEAQRPGDRDAGDQPAAPDPSIYAPNGQPWRLPDGKANPDALPPYARRVWDRIADLGGDEPQRYRDWVTAQELPGMSQMTENQAAMAMEFLEEMIASRPPA